ncbi:Imm21 family immunity protein [Nocardia sp. NPDC051787]|uniref:Imm21 family immunity protein n=1 Tax=Nocardia sp. NPDC051787 TaxID=3155415 RepID=UPI003436F78F
MESNRGVIPAARLGLGCACAGSRHRFLVCNRCPRGPGSQQALVLGDQPARTTYLPAERTFLRWAAADSEEELVAAAQQALQEHITWDPGEDLVWEIREPVMLFDSAWPGTEIELDNQLHIALDPGRYRVRATYIKNPGNWMILVQLQPTVDKHLNDTTGTEVA